MRCWLHVHMAMSEGRPPARSHPLLLLHSVHTPVLRPSFRCCRLEFLEASGCCILACTVAWDTSHAAASSSGNSSGSGGASPAVGFASLGAAVMDAVAALDAVQPPAPPSAGAFKLRRLGSGHTPDEAGWHSLMDGTHAELSAAAAAAAAQQAAEAAAAAAPQPGGEHPLDACTPLLRVSPEAAREEYLLNGQEGLDDLLAALEGGFEAAATPPDAGGLTKVVLARRTDVAIEGRVEPLALLEALQERDPRAYQTMLQARGGCCRGGVLQRGVLHANRHVPCARCCRLCAGGCCCGSARGGAASRACCKLQPPACSHCSMATC